jgi:hypothetical protein
VSISTQAKQQGGVNRETQFKDPGGYIPFQIAASPLVSAAEDPVNCSHTLSDVLPGAIEYRICGRPLYSSRRNGIQQWDRLDECLFVIPIELNKG